MDKKNILSLLLVTPFVTGQLVMAPIAVCVLMFRGILLDIPRKMAVPKHTMTTKVALISNKS